MAEGFAQLIKVAATVIQAFKQVHQNDLLISLAKGVFL